VGEGQCFVKGCPKKSANFFPCYPHSLVVIHLAQKSERYYNDFMLS
jgi:hypothetical protein